MVNLAEIAVDAAVMPGDGDVASENRRIGEMPHAFFSIILALIHFDIQAQLGNLQDAQSTVSIKQAAMLY